jgi:trk system potassium uptake protein TrkH
VRGAPPPAPSAERLGTQLDVRPVLYIIGVLLAILSVAMLVPMAADLFNGGDEWTTFGVSAAVTLFFGVGLVITCHQPQLELSLRQTFVLTAGSWAAVCLFSALPFSFSVFELRLADAVFEAMSGLTTTGSTVIVGLDTAPAGVLLWRSILQWLGGIGIIVMAIAILPFLKVGGMQLFRTEASDRSDKVVPRVSDLAVSLGLIYLALTLACFAILTLAGMPAFDAASHAMSALATGGFSTKDSSLAHWDSAAFDWTLTAFMLAGALPFVRYISFVKGDVRAFWRDSQVRLFLALNLAVWLGLALWLTAGAGMEPGLALRRAAFNATSVITTTGFTSTDYSLWGPPAVVVFFVLTLVGGCTGSTAGAIKIFRFEVLWLALTAQLTRLYSPRQVQVLRYNDKTLGTDILMSVMSFLFVYVMSLLLAAVLLGMLGLDFVTALSGAATALGNVGPGLGPIIGPVGNFSTLPDGAKWVLTAAMLLGRLEFFTILILLKPGFWRQ